MKELILENKYTLDNFLEDLRVYATTFAKYKLFEKNDSGTSINVDITESVEVLIKKFGYYDLEGCDIEIEEVREVIQDKEEDINKYKDYLPIYMYLETLIGELDAIYFRLYKEDTYNLEKEFTFDNYKLLTREQKKYFELPSICPTFDDMVDVVQSVVLRYLWIRRFYKIETVEKLMDIMSSGFFPCGMIVENESDSMIDHNVKFLVFDHAG